MLCVCLATPWATHVTHIFIPPEKDATGFFFLVTHPSVRPIPAFPHTWLALASFFLFPPSIHSRVNSAQSFPACFIRFHSHSIWKRRNSNGTHYELYSPGRDNAGRKKDAGSKTRGFLYLIFIHPSDQLSFFLSSNWGGGASFIHNVKLN